MIRKRKIRRLILFTLIFLGLVCLGLYIAYRYYFSGKSYNQSIYLVPPNAALIIETDIPFTAWETLISSQAWQKLKNNPSLADLNSDVMYLDSLFNDNKLFFRLMGERKLMISMHEYEPDKYDYLFIMNLGNITELRRPEKLLSTFLGSGYRITKTTYKDKTIFEILDLEYGEMYFFCFVLDKGVVSTNLQLVEASIDEVDRKTLGRDVDFLDVSEEVAGKGLVKVYINYKYFRRYLEREMGKPSFLTEDLDIHLTYSGFSFDINPDGQITVEGYTGVNETTPSFFSSILNAGSGELLSSPVIPSRFASMVNMHFEDANDFYDQTLDVLNEEERENFQATQGKLEKKLKISVREDLLSWIDREMVLLQTTPSNLGRMNEFAILLHTTNTTDPQNKLDMLSKQVRRKYFIKIKEVNHRGYAIRYISFPGLFKMLFGKMLDKIEKPYYTIIDKYVIFSNHPQTLKNIIDNFLDGNTLLESTDYPAFTKNFQKKNTVFAYLDIPVLYSYLEEYVSPEKWEALQENKPYVLSFPRAGIQVDEKSGLLRTKIVITYSHEPEEYKKQYYDDGPLLQAFREITGIDLSSQAIWYDPQIIIHDLDDNKVVERFDNDQIRIRAGLKKGQLHGNYEEYYQSGKLRVKGKFEEGMRDGNWVLYDPDGNLVEEKVFSNGTEVTE